MILDATCGSRMIWFDKNHKDTLYVDCRTVDNEIIYKSKNGKIERRLTIAPDVVADFTDLPFENELFDLVVFDPPHLKQIGSNAWMAKKYGKLPTNWKDIIHDGFAECMRVLSNRGTLIFKWNEYQIPVSEIIKVIGAYPLFGNRSGKQAKTIWMVFRKKTQVM